MYTKVIGCVCEFLLWKLPSSFILFYFFDWKQNIFIDMDLKVQVKDEESLPNLQNLIKRRGGETFSNSKKNYTSIEHNMRLYKERQLNSP